MEELYSLHRGNGSAPLPGLSILHKIKLEHIKLTSYSKMRVNLAAQVQQSIHTLIIVFTAIQFCVTTWVLSNTVANAFIREGKDYTKETAKFCQTFNKFFDCLNVRSLKECIHKRKPDMRPYNKKDDNRLVVCYAT